MELLQIRLLEGAPRSEQKCLN